MTRSQRERIPWIVTAIGGVLSSCLFGVLAWTGSGAMDKLDELGRNLSGMREEMAAMRVTLSHQENHGKRLRELERRVTVLERPR